ncbi:signal recognition particle protein [Moraxella sp. FZLJ2107]|uniref:signal recognition particle protein n=1 Tax=unclassified Moraxella TaxID=2685852 RepID=UPI0020C8A849|nr:MULTISPECIES: signal recognition particle protein [unclassified Moraxella]UTO05786.1 signal recognition particle protein [Moraxella sp. FZLJ2107]UTO22522.1 signal recognition particle protein [Moraxella sp. FZLJ2109]
MFDTLTERLSGSLRNIAGTGQLTEDNIKDTLREVRMALLEADVALPVARDFVARVKEQALGQDVLKELAPGQAFVKIVYDELTEMMGSANQTLEMTGKPPMVYLLAGLQGAGKTTTAGKLAKFLQEKQNKKVMLVSADVYRPAAIKQLEQVAGQVKASFVPSSSDEKPIDIAHRAINEAKLQYQDILIIDTAGRLHIDDEMMDEIKELAAAVNPVETLFIVDAMTGQDAANTAKAFNDALPLTGVILTKTDGDARGGAALSVRAITGKPIKFLGRGEKLDALELFHPERIAQRILGMGDVLSLVEEVEQKLDREKAEKMAKKMQKGGEFDLEDLLTQFQQMRNLGGMAGFLDKMPGLGGADIQKAMAEAKPEEKIKEMEALIHSMTPFERQNPDRITPSRKRRIAAGSGRQIQDVNRLLKQHKQMAKMMKMISRPDGIGKMMKAVQGLTRGMSGGGPLFGNKGGDASAAPSMAEMQKSMQDLGLNPNDMPSMEEMQKKMQELGGQLPPQFKKRF